MNISRLFIERPVMTTLLMAALVIFGLFGYATLPVSELPNVDFPTISVNAVLPGADPETMASAVATPLENAFATIPGLDTMTSSSEQGRTRITLQFRLERNIDAAGQDVQAAIAGATRRLPRAIFSYRCTPRVCPFTKWTSTPEACSLRSYPPWTEWPRSTFSAAPNTPFAYRPTPMHWRRASWASTISRRPQTQPIPIRQRAR
jgi:hypothetical protein